MGSIWQMITTAWRFFPIFCDFLVRLRQRTRIRWFSNSRRKWPIWKDRFALGRPVVADSNLLFQLPRGHRPISPLHRHPRESLRARAGAREKGQGARGKGQGARGKGQGARGKGKHLNNAASQQIQSFQQLMDMSKETRPKFFQVPAGSKGTCFCIPK